MLYSWEREYSLTVAGDWPQLGTLTAERHLNVFQALVHSPPIAQVAGLCLCQWGAKGMKDGAGPSESLHKASTLWMAPWSDLASDRMGTPKASIQWNPSWTSLAAPIPGLPGPFYYFYLISHSQEV